MFIGFLSGAVIFSLRLGLVPRPRVIVARWRWYNYVVSKRRVQITQWWRRHVSEKRRAQIYIITARSTAKYALWNGSNIHLTSSLASGFKL